MSGQEDGRRGHERGHERYEEEKHVRGQVREDHGIQEADALGHPRGDQEGESGKQVGAEEERAQSLGTRAEAQMKPVGEKALDDEPAREGVDRLQGSEVKHHGSGPMKAESPESLHRGLGRWLLRALREESVEAGQQGARCGVAQQHATVCLRLPDAVAERPAEGAARGGRPRRRGQECEDVVPAEGAHHGPRPHGARQ